MIKDPVYPKSNTSYLKILSELQRFKNAEWNSIRFSEVQKKYVTTPGFIELNVNDELKRFESSSNENYRLFLLERSFAALTNSILTQKDELRNTLQNLINWSAAEGTTLSPATLFCKIEELFNKQANYTKVSDDILQMVCGRRADCIHSRRELLLKQIQDEYQCVAIQKIPPDSEFLFDNDIFNNYLQKIGGADKLSVTPKTGYKPPGTANQGVPKLPDFPKPSTSKLQPEKPFRHGTSTKRSRNRSSRGSNSRASGSMQGFKGKKEYHNPPKGNKNRRL